MSDMPGPHRTFTQLHTSMYMKEVAMNLKEQRAIVATGIMGYEVRTATHEPIDSTIYHHEAYYGPGHDEYIMPVFSYHPDLEDDRSLGQRERIKKRLRELGYGARGGWDRWDYDRKVFRWEIFVGCNTEVIK